MLEPLIVISATLEKPKIKVGKKTPMKAVGEITFQSPRLGQGDVQYVNRIPTHSHLIFRPHKDAIHFSASGSSSDHFLDVFEDKICAIEIKSEFFLDRSLRPNVPNKDVSKR